MRDFTDWQIQVVDGKMLLPHYKREALIVVDPSLDLITVGKAIAEDQLSQVEDWMGQGLLGKPSQDQMDAWAAIEDDVFHFIIVQPYVLVQMQQS